MSIPSSSFPRKTLFNARRVGREHRVRPSSRVPRKGVSPPLLQNFGQCLQDQDVLSHQGHSCGQEVSSPFFVQSQTSHLPPNTSSSADGTMEISGADGLSFRQEVWLRRATALPLPNLLLCHRPAPARPSHWLCRDLGSRTLCLSYHEPSVRVGCVCVSTAVGTKTRLLLVCSHPLEMGKCPLSS